MENNEKSCLPVSFTYTLNEEKWVRFRKGFIETVNGSTLGIPRLLGISLLCFCCLEGLFFFIVYVIERSLWQAVVLSLLFSLPCFLVMLFRNPERPIRRQAKQPGIQRGFEGAWRITLSEEGITQRSPDGFSWFYPWREMGWMVEGEFAFYLFRKDKKSAAMIPRECFQSWESIWALQELGRRKGLVQIRQQRRTSLPGWFLCLLVILLMLLHAFCRTIETALQETWNVYENTEEGEEYESGMPVGEEQQVYDSVEQQAETLRSLGLTVPEGIVRSVQEDLEDSLSSGIAEKEVYLTLLLNLAWGYIDEEGNFSEGTGEVFWFDFEGWDLSTDYIHILEGMLALAEGSFLDGINEIEEDLEDVNWEKGRGKITVRLTWEGQEYEWDMKVYYDWIDSDVLGILNGLLRETESEKYFYITDDGGQGVIVLFCTKEWAEKFTEATEIKLVRG